MSGGHLLGAMRDKVPSWSSLRAGQNTQADQWALFSPRWIFSTLSHTSVIMHCCAQQLHRHSYRAVCVGSGSLKPRFVAQFCGVPSF
mmetsp:Transcript_19182/g.60777  ORF Transcript_19182/g.60777 Transcript_19182/m.60777 type:complete len:87 (-) Transcript_19182:292-552(-)